jgi:hypothetical protein
MEMDSTLGSGLDTFPQIHPCLAEVSIDVLHCAQPFEYLSWSTQSSVVGQFPKWAFFIPKQRNAGFAALINTG